MMISTANILMTSPKGELLLGGVRGLIGGGEAGGGIEKFAG